MIGSSLILLHVHYPGADFLQVIKVALSWQVSKNRYAISQ